MDAAQLLDLKVWLIDFTGLSRDALHMHIGLAVFLGLWVVFRRRWTGILAWLIILGMAAYGEYLDHSRETPKNYHIHKPEHYRDIINTMFWPTILLILGWFVLRRNAKVKTDDGSGDLPDKPLEEPPSV